MEITYKNVLTTGEKYGRITINAKQIALYNLDSMKRKSRRPDMFHRELSLVRDSEDTALKIISENGD